MMQKIDDILLSKFGVTKRFVEKRDASFVLSLRLDDKLGRFLSHTQSGVSDQEKWIENYKIRENNRREFYFLFENSEKKSFGLSRIYDIRYDSFEIGSWLFSKDSPEGLSILADLATRDYAFSEFNFEYCRFEVRKENKAVVNYHKRFNPTLVDEDDLNIYFTLSREKYEFFRNKILQFYSYGNK